MPFKYSIIYWENSKTSLIKTTYRELITNTYNWIHNRNIDENKVNDLYEELVKGNRKIGWTLHAYLDKSIEEVKLLDGQHRREAIKKFIELNDIEMKNNDEITLWLYEIPNEIEYEQLIIELFTKINSNHPIDPSMLPSQRKMELFRIICNHSAFKSGIRTNPKTITSNPPFISLKEVKIIVDKILTKSKLAIMENSEIIEKLKEINHKISIMAINENLYKLFNKNKLTKKDKDMIDEAHSIKFYLKLKGTIYENFSWIDEI